MTKDDDDPPARCQDYRPDHNGECLNCDEPAFEHDDPFRAKHRPPDVIGGNFYHRDPLTGRLARSAPGAPDAWICRRLADYPAGQLPPGASVASCIDCRAPIVFNPARTVDAPKVCMQCAGIRPLPIP